MLKAETGILGNIKGVMNKLEPKLEDTKIDIDLEMAKISYTHRSPDGTKITIHYGYNMETGQVMDFKFK